MALRTTYCGNVHPAPDLEAWLDSIERYAAPVGVDRTDYGLGVWWNATVARELRGSAEARQRVREFLAQHGFGIWTCNVFPYGGFHDDSVKTAVYAPDWSCEDRLDYTRAVAEVVADLAGAGATVSLSTLPLGYEDGDRRMMARNLARAASALAAIEDRTGCRVVLALEPEPFCLLERADVAADFLQERVFGAPDSPVSEDVMRRHLGVCIDLCHLAVVGEDPRSALDDLQRAGVEVPKIQVSSCLELRDPGTALDALLAFDEPRYLHQTVSFDGALRALDLDEVRARRAEFERADGLRTHFHLPLFWDDAGALGSTREAVEAFLASLVSRPPTATPLLEVETYTWSVLDPAWQPESDLVAGIRKELEFVDGVTSAG